MDGYRLVSKIEDTREKLLIGYQHRFKLSQMPSLKQMERYDGCGCGEGGMEKVTVGMVRGGMVGVVREGVYGGMW